MASTLTDANETRSTTVTEVEASLALREVDSDVKSEVAEKPGDVDVEKTASAVNGPESDAPPDGGLAAWLVIFGCACGGFATFGFANAFGVFQAYYQDRIPGATQSTVAWIGSLQYCLIFLPGLPSGHMTDKGWLKFPLLIGSLVLVTATLLIAECKQLWQLILCQGFAIGGAAGFVFPPSLTVVPQWFDKRRGQAYGLLAIGSAVGGTTLPIILRKLLDSVGFEWTVRILAFILLGLLSIFNVLVRPRKVYQKHEIPKTPLGTLFTNKPFMIYTAAVTIVWLGMYTPLGFFDVSAQRIGVPPSRSFYTIVAANASSGIGRFSSGFWADYLGSMNVLILFSSVAAIMAICWPYAHSFPSLLVVAILYGFASGAFISLLPSAISYMVPRHQLGRAIGLSSTIMSIGALVGNPIAGQILIVSGGFDAVGAWSGGTIFISVILMMVSRRLALGGWKGKY
ncbi:hypothetical protein M407DRAFT_21704 [Tulasnella calospora MUT 4182]|uniref:Major facilitator superfamily (MFS) profile domain-containing protein n=1 Tax=Tulasnella calospora MUT 4182 TaxID=1051891 RepID=A0A0C3M662_9AGAM|nr:hypothetical protein M407DRAFT_21704 [Tulasnella calospora MUT 4182]